MVERVWHTVSVPVLLILLRLPAMAGAAEQLVGDWQLVSFVDTMENGERTYPYGQNPRGLGDAFGFLRNTVFNALEGPLGSGRLIGREYRQPYVL